MLRSPDQWCPRYSSIGHLWKDCCRLLVRGLFWCLWICWHRFVTLSVLVILQENNISHGELWKSNIEIYNDSSKHLRCLKLICVCSFLGHSGTCWTFTFEITGRYPTILESGFAISFLVGICWSPFLPAGTLRIWSTLPGISSLRRPLDVKQLRLSLARTVVGTLGWPKKERDENGWG